MVLESVLFNETFNKDWHMQFSERAALLYMLQRFKPQVSIEIGTFMRGSLRPIAAHSGWVYTFDLDDRSDPEFTNVTFVTGDSAQTLPPLIDQMNRSEKEVGFILIDGSHSEEGVRTDIINCLRYVPKSKPTVILMHDSSNPTCRKGIETAPWTDSPHVHSVFLDFVAGFLSDHEKIKGQIWGGLALAVLLPEKRAGAIDLQAPFTPSLSAMIERSVYAGAA